MKKSLATRARILSEGLAMASTSGLDGVTLGDLAERVGMSKSGLFAHFRSKDAVQISLLDHMAAVVASAVIDPAMRAREGLPRLRVLVEHWFGWSNRAGLPGGCPVAAGFFEYDDVEGPVRNKIQAMELEWRTFVSGIVTEAVRRGDLRADLDVDQFVWELSGIYLSHHASARFFRAPDAGLRARTAFVALVARARVAGSGRQRSVEKPRERPHRHERSSTRPKTRR